jgi:hypothetical protein
MAPPSSGLKEKPVKKAADSRKQAEQPACRSSGLYRKMRRIWFLSWKPLACSQEYCRKMPPWQDSGSGSSAGAYIRVHCPYQDTPALCCPCFPPPQQSWDPDTLVISLPSTPLLLLPQIILVLSPIWLARLCGRVNGNWKVDRVLLLVRLGLRTSQWKLICCLVGKLLY